MSLIKNLKFEFWIFGLVFALLLVFSIHNFDSIGQDIGRHLKTGEIIWQTKEIPKTNLFSFTEPDFPFTNHHWLSEVLFFGIFSFAGFTGLIAVKVILILTTFWLLFLVIRKHSNFWPLLVSLLFSIFIFIQRTEVRPEIFSYAIFAFFLFALFNVKYSRSHDYGKLLWFLPVLELFWVNLHIYFFIGPLLVFFFLIDRTINKKKTNPKSETLNPKQYQNPNFQNPKRFKFFGFKILDLFRISNLEFRIFILVVLATLINPAGIKGALLPFNVLNEYGYSIVENQTLFFLADFFSFNLSIFVFKLSAALLVLSLILTAKKVRNRLFEIIILAFFIYAGFKMLRNLPLYALASFPVLAVLLTDVFDSVKIKFYRIFPKQGFGDFPEALLRGAVAAFLIFMIFFVTSGSFYKKTNSLKEFGLLVPNGLEQAVDFIKQNKIKGPMFNNFDIGGYLIWKLPQEKVFVDNRPEAYSVKFFSEIYKPMQENKEKWAEFSEKYGINFVFFAHTDATPWGQDFVGDIIKDPNWVIVYLNGDAIILVKNNKINSEIMSRFAITEKSAINKTVENIKGLNQDPVKLKVDLSRFFYNINWREPSVYFADEVIKVEPENPYPYLHKGLVHASYADQEHQKLAAENIKKAIDLGLKDSRYYFILGGVYMNLGKLDEARLLFKEALKQDKNNVQAKEFLEKYFSN